MEKKRLKWFLELPKNKLLMLALIFIVVSIVAVLAGNVVFKQGDLIVDGKLGVGMTPVGILDLKTAGPDINIISTTPAATTNANEIFFSLLSSTQERQFGVIQVVSSVITDASRQGTMDFLVADAGGNPAARLTIRGSNVGIGTTSPLRPLHISNVMRLQPRSAVPTTPSSGDIYVDSTPAADELCFYDGVGWQGISSGTDTNCA